ncbi:MAG: pectinesterase family protein [Dictyoglomus sp.]|nr:pectinesterase family protein [Dictyoglomus sp.]MDW8188569.1 pectinesterase family protein [Dictyoglomus sp.]
MVFKAGSVGLLLIILVFLLLGCSPKEELVKPFEVSIINPLKNVVIENPYVFKIYSTQDAYCNIYLNNNLVVNSSIKSNTISEVPLSFTKSRGNNIKIEIISKSGEKCEFNYENILYLPKVHIIVDKNYQGKDGEEINGIKYFNSILKAIVHVILNQKSYSGNRVFIFIKSGSYYEKVTIGFSNISLIGEDVNTTKIYYDLCSGTAGGTSQSASVTIMSNVTGFTAENITFENSFDEIANSSISNKQAVAVLSQADKVVFKNCRFIGNQDTLYIRGGLHYFVDCYIEGDVDFIFGDGKAVFENCTIFSVDRPGISPKGYITAASTPIGKLGFLFENCKLLTNIKEPNSVYLGRPWHPSSDPYNVNSNVVFRNCYMDQHIHNDGWTAMSSRDPNTGETIWFYPETERFYEYQNYGLGAIINDKRRQLSGESINIYSKENFLGNWDVNSFIEHIYEQ